MSAAQRDSSADVTIRIVRLPHGEGLPLPAYQSEDAAGLDIIAALPEDAPLDMRPGERALVPAGFILELPRGYEGQLRPRSGLALRAGVTLLNSPGTVDADYRGEVKVLLVNLGLESVVIRRGDRIAQLVVAQVAQVRVELAEAVSETTRGQGGFGSTGA